MTDIVDIQIARLQKLLGDKKITLSLSDDAKRWLADAGYDPIYGARPLKRTIQKHVQDQLAELILRGDIKSGDEAVVTLTADGVMVTSASAAVNAA